MLCLNLWISNLASLTLLIGSIVTHSFCFHVSGRKGQYIYIWMDMCYWTVFHLDLFGIRVSEVIFSGCCYEMLVVARHYRKKKSEVVQKVLLLQRGLDTYKNGNFNLSDQRGHKG